MGDASCFMCKIEESADILNARLMEHPEEVLHEERLCPTWAEWQEFEEIKTFCRGCQYYRGGGSCALYGESKGGCGDRREKTVCGNCKFYNGEELLPCAVHPLGLKQNCPDWKLNTDD